VHVIKKILFFCFLFVVLFRIIASQQELTNFCVDPCVRS
jgi:hypothetical protein